MNLPSCVAVNASIYYVRDPTEWTVTSVRGHCLLQSYSKGYGILQFHVLGTLTRRGK